MLFQKELQSGDLKTTDAETVRAADYREINCEAYNILAEEYRRRHDCDREKDLRLVQPFIQLLYQQFGNHAIDIFDLGCGSGLNLSMFAEVGFQVSGIDISPRMLEVARAVNFTHFFI